MKTTPEKLQHRIRAALSREKAQLVIKNVRIFHLSDGSVETGDIAVTDGVITGVGPDYEGEKSIDGSSLYAVPGFIDSHVHLESSLLHPSEYEKLVLAHGVTTSICDPHELANVLGEKALAFFFDQAEKLTLDLHVYLSSSVPATEFDTSGACLSSNILKHWKNLHPEAMLAELMNIPGLLSGDSEVLEKVSSFEFIDGHCPLVSGKELNACAVSGVSTCHESTTLKEAQEKIRRGIQVLVREGSASRDLDGLIDLFTDINSPFLAYCTDDRNPLDIVRDGHIDAMIRRTIAAGGSTLAAYRAASWSAAQCRGLRDRGLIAPGRRADIVLVSDLAQCDVKKVICGGRILDESFFNTQEQPLSVPEEFLHSVQRSEVTEQHFRICSKQKETPVIGIRPGSLLTDFLTYELPLDGNEKKALPEQDILKAAVLERHGKNANTGLGFIKGFHLKNGAIASSVGHDSHNLCCVGTNDRDMACAVNELIRMQGGFVAVSDGKVRACLELPVGGLLSLRSAACVNQALEDLYEAARQMGCTLPDPFQALAFVSLPVIPYLKLTDRGLFDTVQFKLVQE